MLDLRNLELITARIIDDIPVLVISCSIQQISCICDSNIEKGESPFASFDSINHVSYVMALAKVKSHFDDPFSQGWKLIEFSSRHKDAW